MYFVYILKSQKTRKRYIGYTKDLEKRLKKHNNGSVRSTRKNTPYKLIYHEEFETKKEAIIREKELKSYKGGDALKKLLNVN